MCEEFDPGGFFTKESHLAVVKSPTIQNFFEDKQAELGSVTIFSKMDPEFPNRARPDEIKLTKVAHSKYIPGATLFNPLRSRELALLGQDRHRCE